MMKKLVNVQWRFIRFSVWMCFVSGLGAVVLFYYGGEFTLESLVFHRLFGLPYVLWIVLFVLFVGLSFGYVFGHSIKQRLELLVEATMKLERGDLSQRAPIWVRMRSA